MRTLIDARDPAMGIPRHVFETRFLRVVKRARIPEPHRNHDIHDRRRFIANVDFAWPDEKVGIEADSYRWHADLPTWEKDRRKDHELVLLGWKIRRVTWGDLRHNADDVTDWIRRARAGAGK